MCVYFGLLVLVCICLGVFVSFISVQVFVSFISVQVFVSFSACVSLSLCVCFFLCVFFFFIFFHGSFFLVVLISLKFDISALNDFITKKVALLDSLNSVAV